MQVLLRLVQVLSLGISFSLLSHAIPRPALTIPVVVSPYGFANTELSVKAGSYVFLVMNRTGFANINVYLERMPWNNVTDNPVQQEFGDSVGAGTARLVRNTKLIPGTYRLRVANRPAWVCAIHVN
jgi:hypothetical protein